MKIRIFVAALVMAMVTVFCMTGVSEAKRAKAPKYNIKFKKPLVKNNNSTNFNQRYDGKYNKNSYNTNNNNWRDNSKFWSSNSNNTSNSYNPNNSYNTTNSYHSNTTKKKQK